MPIRLKQILTPPAFEDPELEREDRTRIASLLNAIIWSALLITLLLIPIFLLFSASLDIFWVLVVMFVIELGTLYLMHIKKVKEASLLLTFAGWAILLLLVFLQGGLTSPFVLFSIVMVMLALLLLGPGYAILLGGLTIVAFSTLLLLDNLQLLPQAAPTVTPVQIWLNLMIVMCTVSALAYLTLNHLRAATSRAYENEQHLVESNRALQDAQTMLEQSVAEQTSGLERRANQLQASIEIINTITSIRDLDLLLNEIATLVGERFGYYHVHVFLADRSGQTLMMRASNSISGKRLIERGFTLKVGQTTIVGKAADTLKPYQAMDAAQDEFYLENPEIGIPEIGIEYFPEYGVPEFELPELHGKPSPESRSEMAFPLITGGRLLGVLDVQSKNEAAFDRENLTILQTLVEHIAIAIENTLLFAEKQQAIEAIQRAYSSMSREAWLKLLRSQPEFGYLCSITGDPVVATGAWSPEMLQASRAGEMIQADEFTLVFPIKIREQVTGVVKLRKPVEVGKWSKDEIELVETISDRLSTALESAQLYDQTQRRAERERLTGEITAKVRATNDPQIILQTAVRELRRALQADRAQILVQSLPGRIKPDLTTRNEYPEFKPPESSDSTTTGESSTFQISPPELGIINPNGEIQSNDEGDPSMVNTS